MSKWNLDTVRSVYAAFARREFPFDSFEEEAEWHTDPALPRPMTHYGRREVASYFKRFIGAWHALGAEPVELLPRPGEKVVAIIRMGPAIDGGVVPTIAHLWTLDHGRVQRVQVFGDREAALAASAAPPAPRSAGPSLADREWGREREVRGPAPEPLASFVRDIGSVGTALDVGCGDGRLTAELSAGELTAADVSLVALKRARKRLPAATIVLLEAGGRLPFETESFDLVLCADTLQEVQDVGQLVAEVKRVLVPDGLLALTTPSHGRATGALVLRRGFGHTFDPRRPPLRFFTRRSLGDLLDLAGFAEIGIDRDDGQLLALARR
jgi:SAM-dependent methyltransferase